MHHTYSVSADTGYIFWDAGYSVVVSLGQLHIVIQAKFSQLRGGGEILVRTGVLPHVFEDFASLENHRPEGVKVLYTFLESSSQAIQKFQNQSHSCNG